MLLGWLFFRAESWNDAMQYLGGIMTWTNGTRVVSPYILSAMVIVILVHLIFQKDFDWAMEIPQRRVIVRILNYATIAILIACLGAADSTPFIYFKF